MISIEEVIHCNNLAEAVAVWRARQSPSGHKTQMLRNNERSIVNDQQSTSIKMPR